MRPGERSLRAILALFLPRARLHLSIAILFFSCLTWFLYRGPYRAIRYSTTGDFSTVYAATRCWLHGSNPYQPAALKAELRAAGAPVAIENDQDINPSVYLPAALPWVVPFALLPWYTANALWCLLLVIAFAASVAKIVECIPLAREGKSLVVCAALLFSPTYVGIYDGNPSVLIISLLTVAICQAYLGSARTMSSCLLGVSLSFKPQLAIGALCLFALWKRPRPLVASAVVFGCALAIGVLIASHFGISWRWWAVEQRNILRSLEPGGQSDPATSSAVAWQLLNTQTLVAYLVRDRQWWNAIVWTLAAVLVAIYLYRRTRAITSSWQDASFFAALTLLITYHRYYDAQLLLLLIPLLIELWRTRERATIFALCLCLLLLAMPWQSIFERRLGPAATAESWQQFLMLRHQPVAVLAIAVLLAFRRQIAKQAGIKTLAPGAS